MSLCRGQSLGRAVSSSRGTRAGDRKGDRRARPSPRAGRVAAGFSPVVASTRRRGAAPKSRRRRRRGCRWSLSLSLVLGSLVVCRLGCWWWCLSLPLTLPRRPSCPAAPGLPALGRTQPPRSPASPHSPASPLDPVLRLRAGRIALSPCGRGPLRQGKAARPPPALVVLVVIRARLAGRHDIRDVRAPRTLETGAGAHWPWQSWLLSSPCRDPSSSGSAAPHASRVPWRECRNPGTRAREVWLPVLVRRHMLAAAHRQGREVSEHGGRRLIRARRLRRRRRQHRRDVEQLIT